MNDQLAKPSLENITPPSKPGSSTSEDTLPYCFGFVIWDIGSSDIPPYFDTSALEDVAKKYAVATWDAIESIGRPISPTAKALAVVGKYNNLPHIRVRSAFGDDHKIPDLLHNLISILRKESLKKVAQSTQRRNKKIDFVSISGTLGFQSIELRLYENSGKASEWVDQFSRSTVSSTLTVPSRVKEILGYKELSIEEMITYYAQRLPTNDDPEIHHVALERIHDDARKAFATVLAPVINAELANKPQKTYEEKRVVGQFEIAPG